VTTSSTGSRLTWDGRNKSFAVVPDGTYRFEISPMDRAGNVGAVQSHTVDVYGSLGYAKASKTLFFPQDGDAVSTGMSFSFKLASPATVSWSIVDPAGGIVKTIKTDEALAAGTFSFAWNGRNDLGAFVPRGTYRAVVRASNGAQGSSLSTSALADAFKISVSDTTPARRQRITITTTSAETLSTTPRVTIYQPGISGYSTTMTKVSTGVYRLTITLKSSSTGTLRIVVSGKDKAGHSQSSTKLLPLH
jgi:flagellar hook assembly protein FlgD